MKGILNYYVLSYGAFEYYSLEIEFQKAVLFTHAFKGTCIFRYFPKSHQYLSH